MVTPERLVKPFTCAGMCESASRAYPGAYLEVHPVHPDSLCTRTWETPGVPWPADAPRFVLDALVAVGG